MDSKKIEIEKILEEFVKDKPTEEELEYNDNCFKAYDRIFN